MDDELNQLEAELKRLRPRASAGDLLARIERDLASAPEAAARTTATAAQPARRPSPFWWLAIAGVPAAAAFAVMLALSSRHPAGAFRQGAFSSSPTTASGLSVTPALPAASSSGSAAAADPALFKPVSTENVLYSARDEGIVTLDDGTPARRERLNFMDTIVWKNPRTNALVRWTIPREEVRVTPVVFQ